MPTLETYHRYGKQLEEELRLRTAPIAVKMIASEAEVPEGALRPHLQGEHYAQCQAFSQVGVGVSIHCQNRDEIVVQHIVYEQGGNCCFSCAAFPCHGNHFRHLFLFLVKVVCDTWICCI